MNLPQTSVSFRLRAGKHIDITGPLALIAGQAAAAVATGKPVLVSDKAGTTYAVRDNHDQIVVRLVGQIDLFDQDTVEPSWPTRLTNLINQKKEETTNGYRH